MREDGLAVASEETLSGRPARGEMIFLALRTISGLSKSAYQEKFKEEVAKEFGAIISELTEAGFLIDTPEHLFIPQDKMALADAVAREFL